MTVPSRDVRGKVELPQWAFRTKTRLAWAVRKRFQMRLAPLRVAGITGVLQVRRRATRRWATKEKIL
jgi:hypothetical protein